MRTQDEIVRAHDKLVAFILGEVAGVEIDDEDLERLAVMAKVLCWVLAHDHDAINDEGQPTSFASMLAELDALAAQAGMMFVRSDPPATERVQ